MDPKSTDGCLEHIGLVYALARRFLGRGTDYEDLVQIGAIGLMRAYQNFDAQKNCAFSTYAVPVIAGEIRSFLREQHSMKLSRTVLKNAALLRKAQGELGESAPIGALAKAAGLSEEDAAIAIGAVTTPKPLEEEREVADAFAQADFARLYDRMSVEEGLKLLNDADRRLILLRYYHGLSQRKTGEVLGLSQVQVSRAEKRILEFLRKKLA